jgi:hypothetical protein
VIDVAHLLQRLSDPFNPESRFYWPLVLAIFLAMAAHTAWYLWRPTKPRDPVRDQTEALAYWVDIIALILLLVLVSAKVRAWMLLAWLVVEWVVLGFLYFVYAPPRHEAWAREERKRKFIPEPRRRAARR